MLHRYEALDEATLMTRAEWCYYHAPDGSCEHAGWDADAGRAYTVTVYSDGSRSRRYYRVYSETEYTTNKGQPHNRGLTP